MLPNGVVKDESEGGWSGGEGLNELGGKKEELRRMQEKSVGFRGWGGRMKDVRWEEEKNGRTRGTGGSRM